MTATKPAAFLPRQWSLSLSFSFRAIAIASILPALCPAQTPPQYNISTVVGNTTGGYAGDGGPAASAEINQPFSCAYAGGNLYIADQLNNRIRLVTGNGNVVTGNDAITTVAGNGTSGYAGDGAPAGRANLYSPSGVAVDGSGNIYIADTTNNAVRLVSTKGIISTVAGGLGAGYYGDGGAANGAALTSPSGVALDRAGNLYIADTGNSVVRKVTNPQNNGTITTVAGNGGADYGGDGGSATGPNAQLNNPEAVALDTAGNLYIADTRNNRIRMVSTSGVITTIAGNGVAGRAGDGAAATVAEISNPEGVAVDSAGNLYIADTYNNRIRIVTNGVINTVAGTGGGGYAGDGGPSTKAELLFPSGVAVDAAGNVYVSDTQNNVIRLLTVTAPGGGGGPVPVVTSVENSATGQVDDSTHGAAPNSFISIYASNVGTVSSGSIFPATYFQGIKVLFNGEPAPLYSVTVAPTFSQINVVVPSGLPDSGTANLSVQNASGIGQSFALTLAPADVAVFRFTLDTAHPDSGAVTIAGKAWDVMAASTAAAYKLMACTGLSAATLCGQPAKPGDNISVYFTGGGLATPNADPYGQPVAPGAVAPVDGSVLYKMTQAPTVTIGGVDAPVLFAGIAPGTAAEYQLNTTIPASLQSSDSVPLAITVGSSSDTVTIAIQTP
jgi:uncharacterized protein (TIGR03437 family)